MKRNPSRGGKAIGLTKPPGWSRHDAAPGYPMASYGSYADLVHALERDFHIRIGSEYDKRKIEPPVKLTGNCMNLYLERSRYGFRLLITKDDLSIDRAAAEFARRR